MERNQEKFDVAVIGGGPAGMMAAGRAAELGAKVVLIEKNKSFGKKLLITGKGRCNITQAEFSDQEFIKTIGKKGKFLFSSLNLFGPQKVINFFERKGLKTKTERGGRVFPISDKSQDVLNILLGYLKKNGVVSRLNEKVMGFECKENKINCVHLENRDIYADNVIITAGGKSYPATGSTGEGFDWANKFGHVVKKTFPALVPIRIEEDWVENLQGLSLKNVELGLYQNNKKQSSYFGEMLFTHFGISGPIVLDASREVSVLLNKGRVEIKIDLKPALEFSQLEERLKRDFEEFKNRDFVNYLSELIPQKMIQTFVELAHIDPRKKINLVTKEERKNMVKLLKEMKLNALETTGYNQAIITSGGVDLREVNSKTMQSRIIENLYWAGEVLDIDGPTGGYNLQIAWSTGFSAGEFASKK